MRLTHELLAKFSPFNTLTFEYFDSSGNTISPASAIRVKVSVKLNTRAGVGNEINTATTEAILRND